MISILAVWAATSLKVPIGGPIITPYRASERLMARRVVPPSEPLVTNVPAEFDIDFSATYDNPFDPSDISVTVLVEGPNRRTMQIPGFFTIPCTRSLKEGTEVVTKAGAGAWKSRITFESAGTYTISAIAKDRTGSSVTDTLEVTVASGKPGGFVRISPRDKRYFETSDGKSFFPLGANVCWGGDAGTYSYDLWIPKYAEQNANVFRVWLSPTWATFGLEQKGPSRDGFGLGQLSFENLWRLDYVLDLARKNNMKVKLCIESFNSLQEKAEYANWAQTPHSIANGGILHSPSGFWDNPAMDKFFEMKLRYLIARYAADPAVFAWEFWNEVDLVDRFDPKLVQAWHQKFGKMLRTLDPYRHPITTSFANVMGVKDVDILPEIDYIQTHSYNAPDLINPVATQQSRKSGWNNKPHYVGEIGADFAGPRTEDDPAGIQIHDPLWASIALGSSGAAQPWWWDNLIEPKNLYFQFGAAARFLEGVDFPGENFRQTRPELVFFPGETSTGFKDVNFSGGTMEWKAHPDNVPKTFTITAAGVTGPGQPAGLLHGAGHSDCLNPVTLIIDAPQPTQVDVIVDTVSGYGGGKLEIEVDYSVAKVVDFADPDGLEKTDTLTQYAGAYSVNIPAGRHRVVIRNKGQDWIASSYRIRNVIPRTAPPLVALGTVGDTIALAWVRQEDRTWRRVCVLKDVPPAAPPSIFKLKGLASGRWKVELWDTWKGAVVSTSTVRVGLDSILKVNLPRIESDLAVKAIKQ